MSELAYWTVRSQGFRWLPGMATSRGRVTGCDRYPHLPGGDDETHHLDLADPATGGALLSLIEGRIELTRDPLGGWRLSDVSWEVYADTLGQACARLVKLRGYWGADDAP